MDSPATHDSLHKKVGLWPCHNQGGNQVNVHSIIKNELLTEFYDRLCDDLYIYIFVYLFQYWMLSKQGEIRRDEACLDYAGTQIILYPCHGSKGNQYWEYNDEVNFRF